MKLKYNNKNIYITKSMILIFFIFIVLLAKLVRYTILKQTLVDTARGDEILFRILYNHDLKFLITNIGSSAAMNNAAVIFKLINIFGLTTYTQFEIYITILWNILLLKIIVNIKEINNNIHGLFIILTIAVLNIFNFTIAKEPIQILYFIILYQVLYSKLSDKKKYLLLILIIILTTFTYRSYYVLFGMFTIVATVIFKVFMNKQKKIKTIEFLFLFLLLMIIFYVFLRISKIVFPDSYSEMIWIRTKGHSANTSISLLFPGASKNLLLYTLEFFFVILRLVFPIELLLMGPKYFLYVLYQMFLTSFLIKAIKSVKTSSTAQRYALYLFLGFLLMSAVFEPDFGSWVRHEASAFPIIIVMAGLEKKRKGE